MSSLPALTLLTAAGVQLCFEAGQARQPPTGICRHFGEYGGIPAPGLASSKLATADLPHVCFSCLLAWFSLAPILVGVFVLAWMSWSGYGGCGRPLSYPRVDTDVVPPYASVGKIGPIPDDLQAVTLLFSLAPLLEMACFPEGLACIFSYATNLFKHLFSFASWVANVL